MEQETSLRIICSDLEFRESIVGSDVLGAVASGGQIPVNSSVETSINRILTYNRDIVRLLFTKQFIPGLSARYVTGHPTTSKVKVDKSH